MALHLRGTALTQLGRHDEAESAFQEAAALAEGSGNLRLLAMLDNSFGCLALERGQAELARSLLTRAVARRSNPFRGLAFGDAGIVDSLACAELACGDVDAADRSWRESLRAAKNFVSEGMEAICLGGLSRIATARGDHPRAIRLAAANVQGLAERSIVSDRYWVEQLARSLEVSRSALGPRKSEQAWSEGLAMGLERAVEYALQETTEPVADSGPLSRRELEVARLVAAGMTNRDIAEKLFISERTAEGHLEKIRNKLGFRSRTEVARWAVEHGLVNKTLDPSSAGTGTSHVRSKGARAGTGPENGP
jgi:non-specific serine/threonine protein kinase